MNSDDELAFAWRTIKKVFVFVVVALSAAGLHLVVKYMEAQEIPRTVTLPLSIVEYFVLFADFVWLIRFLAEECAESFVGVFKGRLAARIFAIVALLILGALVGPYLKQFLVAIARLIIEILS